ncbi:MerR family transcriptional regulator [Duganella violaceipulchra]|uniref:MerR family mercuric resistance operon transcriptional regulator n=1 Tax=Duganella violaceipulchra TaxID=2849652 RepID=A0AA41L9Z5_9BURK|nr:MerR family transcriptional regulator [Duganella violaceicalia]MBV6323740.1 MerR family transcriptional regulator [Duganella violaceicalia]MCP2007429.1 MerR family mercuric resistance operon transcriptional regulator [Duganella violaceicalia]
MDEKMTIGRLAAAAKVNVETVRFYQRSGLIDEPIRPHGGYRTYSDGDIRRIRFIKRAQLLGFALDEISSLLRLEGSLACSSTRDLAARKRAMVESKLTDLQAMKIALEGMVARCGSEERNDGCPIIQTLIAD